MDELGITDKVITIPLGAVDYPLDFTMASIYYLAEKYGDVAALFSSLKKGVDTKSLDVISDLIYAGIGSVGEDDIFKSPLTSKKIMAKIHFGEIGAITEMITKAFGNAFPDAKGNPMKGAKAPAVTVSGIGDISIPSEPSTLD
jgi:hypothetical protein